MSTQQDKPTKLQDALEYLDSIWSINCGGCGISALAIYRWCKAHDIEVSERPFVFLNDDEWENERNEERLTSGNLDAIIIPNHIAIELDGTLHDSTGELDWYPDDWSALDYHLNEAELLAAINTSQPRAWNSDFNREKHIPKIVAQLEIDLSDVEGWQ